VADKFLLLDLSDRTLAEVAVIEIIGAVEVVETVQGTESTITIEGMRSATSD